MSNHVNNRVKSAWTPLSNDQANKKLTQSQTIGSQNEWQNMASNKREPFKLSMMFEERRVLVSKWFDKWSDQQRREVMGDLLARCKTRQIEFCGDLVAARRPVYHDDFTRHLPRVLSLYVLSFLDPRSLSRCSRVCWHWKALCEVDQLWLPKCVKLGWQLGFSPSVYENGIWKRFYIENVTQLKTIRPKDGFSSALHSLNLNAGSDTARSAASSRPSSRMRGKSPRPGSASPTGKRPAWKGSYTTPTDTWRNNYLDNDNEIDKVEKLRKKGLMVGNETAAMLKKVKTKINTGHKKHPSPSLPTSKSTPGFHTHPGARPDWAQPMPDSITINNNTKQSSNYYATKTVHVTSPNATKTVNMTSPGTKTVTMTSPGTKTVNMTSPGTETVNMTSPATKTVVLTSPNTNETIKADILTITRPEPVISTVIKKHRTPNDPPPSGLFTDRPWNIPDGDDNDSDTC